MKFEENLEKALLLKTLKNKTLLLFVNGNDSSKEKFLQDCLNNDSVGDKFENIIAVKLERDSKHYDSFVEIYPELDEPFIIFLGDKGIPMRIVKLHEHFNKEEVCKRVNEAILFCDSKTSKFAGDNENKMTAENSADLDDIKNGSLVKTDDIDKDIQLLRALIQFRMPDGAVTIHAFKYDATVAELRSFVENVIKPDSQFQLALPHPFQVLHKDSSTIFDLDLFPSAVVMVIPVHENSLISAAGRTIQSCVFMLPFSIIMNFFVFLFGTIQSWVQGVASRVTGNYQNYQHGQPRTINLQGNIHTLRSGDSNEDDSNNTYNGNSTQQK